MLRFVFIFLALLVISLGFVGAVGDYDRETEIRFIGKQNQNLTVYDSCTNNGEDCDASYYCNFTIIKPNNDILVNNVQSTKVGNLYLYNLTEDQTADIGVYEVNNYCYNGTNAGRLTFYYEVNYIGEKPTEEMMTIYLIAIALLIGLILVIAWIIKQLPSKDAVDDNGSILQVNQLKHLRPVLFGICWVIIIAIFFIVSNLAIAYLPNLMIGELFFTLYQILFWITIVALPLWFIKIFLDIWKDKEVKQMLERGVDMKHKF